MRTVRVSSSPPWSRQLAIAAKDGQNIIADFVNVAYQSLDAFIWANPDSASRATLFLVDKGKEVLGDVSTSAPHQVGEVIELVIGNVEHQEVYVNRTHNASVLADVFFFLCWQKGAGASEDLREGGEDDGIVMLQ